MDKEYDFLIFIGRMRPFHNGHRKVIEIALNKARYVIVLVGSSFEEPTIKNPWLYNEVREMIQLSFPETRIITLPLENQCDDEKWVNKVNTIVNGLVSSLQPDDLGKAKIGLVGHLKDDSSYYLTLFPEWDRVEIENTSGINATDIRKEFFLNSKFLPYFLSMEVQTYLLRWKMANSKLYYELRDRFIAKL